MAALTGRPIDRVLQQAVPLLTGLAAVGIDLLPVPDAAPVAMAPLLTVAVVFYWSLSRPGLMGPVGVTALGLVHDLVAGLPPGLTALVLLLVRSLAVSSEVVARSRSPLLAWGAFALIAGAALALRWLLASLWWLHPFPLRPTLFELALTVVVYPLPAALLAAIDRRLGTADHAPGV